MEEPVVKKDGEAKEFITDWKPYMGKSEEFRDNYDRI
ncbi:unnamed protein product, partial [marine sediment metagenome]